MFFILESQFRQLQSVTSFIISSIAPSQISVCCPTNRDNFVCIASVYFLHGLNFVQHALLLILDNFFCISTV